MKASTKGAHRTTPSKYPADALKKSASMAVTLQFQLPIAFNLMERSKESRRSWNSDGNSAEASSNHRELELTQGACSFWIFCGVFCSSSPFSLSFPSSALSLSICFHHLPFASLVSFSNKYASVSKVVTRDGELPFSIKAMRLLSFF